MYWPPVSHEDEAGDAVESGHAEVRQGKVNQKIVGQAPHPPEQIDKWNY